MNNSGYPGYNEQYAFPNAQYAPAAPYQTNGQYAQSGLYAAPGQNAAPGLNAAPGQYTQPAQYQSAAPQIRNPFAPPPTASEFQGASNQFDAEKEAIANWHSAYVPADQLEKVRKTGRDNANLTPLAQLRGTPESGPDGQAGSDAAKRTTVVRHGGGKTWEDPSLLEWDPTHFRIMVGNLAGEVTDESLAKAFAAYGVSKARVVRDKISTKSKGYGFVSFYDGEQGFKAAREMSNKYIGSHPVTIQRSKTDLRPVASKNDNKNNHKNSHHKNKDNKKKNKGKKDKANDDVLKANTGGGISKTAAPKPPAGLKLLG